MIDPLIHSHVGSSDSQLKHVALWDPLILKARSGAAITIAVEEGT